MVIQATANLARKRAVQARRQRQLKALIIGSVFCAGLFAASMDNCADFGDKETIQLCEKGLL